MIFASSRKPLRKVELRLLHLDDPKIVENGK